MALGEAQVEIRATLDRLDGDLSKAKSAVSSAIRGIGQEMQTLGKIAFTGVLTGIAAIGTGIALVARQAIPAASDLNEALNASSVVFGTAAGKIQEYGRVASETAGLSAREFNQMGAQTGAMLKNLGYDVDSAADNTIALTQRAADMASIFNTDVGEALAAVQSGLQGQSMPLRKFGVDLSDAAIRAHALEMGLGDVTRQTDSYAYTQASLSLLMKQTDDIAGDFLNTSDQLANAARVQKARWENFMATLGTAFLPVVGMVQSAFMDLAEGVMPKVLAIVEPVAAAFQSFTEQLMAGVDPVTALSGLIVELGTAFGLSQEKAEAIAAKFREVVDVVTNLVNYFRMVITEGDALNDFLSNLPAPIQPIVRAIGELVAFIVDLVSKFVSWKDVLLALGLVVGVFVAAAIIPILKLIAVFTLIVAGISLVRNAWDSNWGGIRDKVQAVIGFIVPLVQNAIAGIKAWWAAHGDAILSKAAAIWDAIRSAISSTITAIQSIIRSVLDAIRGAWSSHGADIVTIATWAMGQIQGVITMVTGVIRGIWETFGGAIKANATLTWNLIKSTIESILSIISSIIRAIAAAIRGDWEAAGNHLRSAAETAWQAIKNVITTNIQAAKNGLEAALSGIQANFQTAMGNVVAAVQPAIDVVNGILGAVKSFWEFLKGKVFEFKINLPSLPSWATPGSPLPIHVAWKDFAQEMNALTIKPKFDLDAVMPIMLEMEDGGGVGQVAYNSSTVVNTNRDPMQVLRASRHLDRLGGSIR